MNHRATILGALFFLLAFGLAAWAFYLGCLEPDQRWIIRHFVPIFCALAASQVVGGIYVTGNVTQNLAVSASGGMAVWLLIFLFLPAPTACAPAQVEVTRFALLDERGFDGLAGNVRMTELKNRQNTSFQFANLKSATIALVAVVRVSPTAFSIPGTELRTKLVIRDKSDGGKQRAEVSLQPVTSFESWKSMEIVKGFGWQQVSKKLDLRRDEIPFVVALKCFEDRELPARDGTIDFNARLWQPEKTRSVEFTIVRRPTTTATVTPPGACG